MSAHFSTHSSAPSSVGPEIVIRPAALTDVSAFRALRLEGLQLHPEAFASDYATQAAYPDSYWQQRVAGICNNPQQIFYLAQAADQLVGMTGIVRGESVKNQHSALIISVYVQPAYRSLGLGQQLLQACLKWARQQGVSIVKLGVAVKNQPAVKCYQRCGFVEYGREPQALCVNGQMIDELLMALSLA